MYRRVFYSLLLLGALLVGIGLLPQRALAASQSNNMSNKSNSGFVYCYSLSCGGLPPTYQTAAQTTLFLLMNEGSNAVVIYRSHSFQQQLVYDDEAQADEI